MDQTWMVTAVKYAERNSRTKADSFLFDDDHASQHDMDYFLWVMQSPLGTIVVDTGYDTKEGKLRQRPILREPEQALAEIGIDAAEVETVIVTHLHYDHAGSLDRFPYAMLHVQSS